MKIVSSLFTSLCLVLLTGLACINGSALASTPDGLTPANEGVCDSLKADGVTKGLYGLCVAYCEAQDLDSIDKPPPSTKILENYNRKKTANDPIMPCLHVPCPCWSEYELTTVNGNGTAACNRLGSSIQIIDNTPLQFADVNADPTALRCRYVDLGLNPTVVRINTINQQEADACFAAIDQICP